MTISRSVKAQRFTALPLDRSLTLPPAAGIAEDAGPDKSYSARYLRTEDGVPLSTKELHELSVSGALPDGPAAEGVESPALVEKTDIQGVTTREPLCMDNITAGSVRSSRHGRCIAGTWVAFFSRCQRHRCGQVVRFAIALRNDYLSEPNAPAENEHGATQYHWDGYLWWTDDADPRYPEYSLQTQRAQDMYYSVNQTRAHLTQSAEGALSVQLESFTPNLSHYEVRVDGGEWEQVAAENAEAGHTVQEAAGDGERTIEARAVNQFGKAGASSSVVVGAAEAALADQEAEATARL